MSYSIYDYYTMEFIMCSDFSGCYDFCVEKNLEIVSREGSSGQIWYVTRKY